MGFLEGLLSIVGAGPANADTGISEHGINNPRLTMLPQDHKHAIAKMIEMPSRVSAQDVVSATHYAAQAEGSAALLQKYTQQRLKAANAHASAYQTGASYLNGMQRINNRVQATETAYARNVANYGLNTQQNAAAMSGYLTAFNQARQGINL